MPKFQYTALQTDGSIDSGVIEEKNYDAAAEALQRRGSTILALDAVDSVSGASLPWKKGASFFSRRVSNRDLLTFSRDLAMLLKGGVPMLKCLSLLCQRSVNPSMKTVLVEVAKAVGQGTSLAKALNAHPEVFPRFFTALLEAGEASGSLVPVLKQYVSYVDRQEQIKRKVIGAMAYPAIVSVVAAGVVLFLTVKVIPTFAMVFATFRLKLPGSTLALIAISRFIREYYWLFIFAATGAYLGLAYARTTYGGRSALSRCRLKMPVFKPMFEDALFEQFFASFGLLLKSGVSLLPCFHIMEDIFDDDPPFQEAIKKIAMHVTQGKSFSDSMRLCGLFSETAIYAVGIGEEVGLLYETLENMAESHAENMEIFVQQLNTLIEPIMVVGVGGMVGFIMFSIFRPLMELVNLRTM